MSVGSPFYFPEKHKERKGWRRDLNPIHLALESAFTLPPSPGSGAHSPIHKTFDGYHNGTEKCSHYFLGVTWSSKPNDPDAE